MAHVVVAGLGPAGAELVTAQTQAEIGRIDTRILRTAVHPSAHVVPDARTCDDLYDRGETFAEVYGQITERVVAAAQHHGEVLYAVPGSPRVLEHSVEHLVADPRVETTVLPALSFLDLAWVRLGIDPIEAGVRLVDGHTFATSAAGERGPLLVAHCHNQRVLSDIKLAVDEPPETPVTVMARLGLPDEHLAEVPWAELDRDVAADHLTSLYIPRLAAPVATELVRFGELVATLRRECPWDSQQTHQSLRRHLVEEAYEVLEAIDGFDPVSGQGADHLEEELGDLLFQVFFHALLGAEEGWFDLADVARTVHDKLHARHPHVFAGVAVSGADEVYANWEVIKAAEKGRASVMDGLPMSLPALSLAEKVIKKAAGAGVGFVPRAGSLAASLQAVVDEPTDETVGKVLFDLVALSQGNHLDPEQALRGRIHQAIGQVRAAEAVR